MDYSALADVCERAARAAGKLLVAMQPRVTVREKGPKDLVTEADLAAQEIIESLIHEAYPDHKFLGEESPHAESLCRQVESGYRWIVDPLDGTVNYAHGMPAYAVSVAVESEGQVLAGVVLDPLLNECYRAAKDEGAFLNGVALRPSECRELRSALVAASLPAIVTPGSAELARFLEVLYEAQALRRLGSSALNMCYVAAGRLDGYWATSVKAWDVAAGALLIREAGGQLTNIDGGPFQLARPQLIAAATTELHEELLAVLRRAEKRGNS